MTHDKLKDGSVARSGRRSLLALAGLLAGLGGAGLAWWRFQPNEQAEGVEAAFWSMALETPGGKPLTMRQWRGKPLMVNFWATWCPPCIEELPMLDQFFAENSTNGWQVLGIAVDQTASVVNFLEKHSIRFPMAMAGAAGSGLSKALGNRAGGLPFTVVFGSDGRISARKIGKVSPADLVAWRQLK